MKVLFTILEAPNVKGSSDLPPESSMDKAIELIKNSIDNSKLFILVPLEEKVESSGEVKNKFTKNKKF